MPKQKSEPAEEQDETASPEQVDGPEEDAQEGVSKPRSKKYLWITGGAIFAVVLAFLFFVTQPSPTQTGTSTPTPIAVNPVNVNNVSQRTASTTLSPTDTTGQSVFTSGGSGSNGGAGGAGGEAGRSATSSFTTDNYFNSYVTQVASENPTPTPSASPTPTPTPTSHPSVLGATTAFSAKIDSTTGAHPESVATGDFNGDGKTDLAVANYSSNTASIYVNTGSGLPTTATSTLTAGTSPYSVTTGDFNGDGKTDLAVANAGSNTVSIYINTGSGLPTTATSTLTTGSNPQSVTTGDFNGDGKTDLAVANYGSSGFNGVSIYTNTGSALPTTATSNLTTGTNPQSVTTGDFNGDGKTDLAVANFGNGTVSIYINTGSGLPTTATSTLTAGTSPYSVTTGDFNGDGKTDLAVTNYNSNTVSVYINTGSGLSTTATSTLTTGSAPYSVVTGDFNGDGKTDLAVTNSSSTGANGVSIYTNTGSALPTTATSTLTTGSNPHSVTIGDFNGDFKTDLAVANYGSNTVSVFLNSSVFATFSAFSAKIDSTTGVNPHSVTSADFNGDGKPDLAVANYGSTGTNGVSVYINTGSGIPSTATYTLTTGSTPVSVTTGDFNGDGRPDLVVANEGSTGPSGVSIYINTGSGLPTTATYTLTTGSTPESVTTGDFNGDGKTDLAVANEGSNTVSIYINTGYGLSGTATYTRTTGYYPYSVTTGDFNGDGKTDLAVANAGSAGPSGVYIYTNTGSGIPEADTAVNTGPSPHFVTTGDFNGDGKTDLAVANSNSAGSNGVSIYINTGSGFSGTATSALVTGGHPISVTTGDFNGDGRTDLAVANELSTGPSGVSIYTNTGSALPTTATSTLTTGSTPESVTTGDFNGDGRTDLAVANYISNTVSIFLNSSTTNFGMYTSIAMASDGFPRISYYDANGASLMYAQCTSYTCDVAHRITTVVDSTGNVGQYTSIALGTDGFARISYNDTTNGDLKFAQCTNAACTTKNITSVDTTGNVGYYTSIALGTDGFARISYYDDTNSDLKFAQCTNATCTTSNITSVDTTGIVGYYTSIALGTDGFARISYYDASFGDLRYAQCTNAACTTKNITSVDATGAYYTSIAIGTDGFARISYYDANSVNLNLKFAQCTNAACTTKNITNVDTTGDVGYYSSIAMGTDGFARISYYDTTNGDLKYAKCTNAACTTKNITSVDTAGTVGQYTDIAVGTDGLSHISYYDATNGTLKVWTESPPVVISSFYYQTAPASGTAGNASTVFTVGAKDVSGNIINAPSGTPVYLYSSSGTGTFSTTSGGTYTSTLSITIPSGSPTTSFYYKDNTAGSYTIYASDQTPTHSPDTGITDATTAYTVNAATLAKFTFTPASTTAIAGSPTSSLAITAQDTYGNAVNVGSPTVMTLTDGGAGGQFSLTSSPFTPAGTATIATGTSTVVVYYRNNTIGVKTLTAHNNSYTDATASVTITTATINSLYYTTAPASGPAGSASTVFTVGAHDLYGNVVVVTSNTTVYLYSTSGTGTFSTTSGGTYTPTLSITIPSGGTTASYYYKDATAGSYTLTASDQTPSPTPDTGLVNATTAYTVNATALAKFTFSPTAATVAGTPTGPLTITARDAFNNPVNVGSPTIMTLTDGGAGGQFSLTSSPFTPTATATITTGTSSVVVYYQNATTGTYTLNAHNDSYTDATASITITSASIASFYYFVAPASGTAGAASTVFTVGAKDSFGNVITVTSNTTVYLYSTSGTGTFSATSGGPYNITSVVIPNGSATADFYYKDNTAGSYTLTGSDQSPLDSPDTGLTNATTAYTVNATTLAKFTFSPTTTTVADVATPALVITARDVFNNPVNVGSPLVLTLSDGDAGQFSLTSSPFTPTPTATITTGTSSVTVYYRNTTTGTYTLNAHNDSYTDATASVTIVSAAIASFYYATAPASGAAGSASTVFTVGAKDEFGNIVIVSTNTTVYLYSTSGTGTFATSPGGPYTVTSVIIPNGSATADFYYKDNTAGSYTLTGSEQSPLDNPDTGLTNATTSYHILGVFTPVSSARQLTGRSVTLGTSAPSDNTADFQWHSAVNANIKAIRIQLCTTPIKSDLCTTPAGASMSSTTLTSTGGQLGAVGGWTYGINNAQDVLLTNPTGAAVTIGSQQTVGIDGFINPSTYGTFFFRITTYSDVSGAANYSLEYGAVATSTAKSITTSANVGESLIFRVANTVSANCTSQTDVADPNNTTEDLVTLSPASLSLTNPSVATAQFCASTNAQYGYVISYHDEALGGPTKGFWNGAHEFGTLPSSPNGSGTFTQFTSTPGTEQFGFNLRDNVTFGFDPDGNGLVADLLNPDYATVNRFSYDDSGNTVPLAQKTSPNAAAARYTISYLANINPLTPGGTYQAHQVFVIVATY